MLCGCSTKKNTAYRRFYHGFTTHYNVQFNAVEAYKKGYKKIETGYQPDYSHIINMFAVSSTSTQGLGKTDMGVTTTKCQKAIKEHSLKKKPKKNMNRLHDPKYMEFYNQEEFNPRMKQVWMLLGKSQYYSNDYLAASATFTYIAKHFTEDKKTVAEATIWKAKSLKEMDWTFEAEGILGNLSDEGFDDEINCLYSEAYADLKIKQGEEKEALPYLETAISLEKNHKLRTRFRFIAAQIYQEMGQKSKSYDLYGQVIKSSPDYQMGFNARIRQTEVYDGQNSEDLIKTLQKMARKSNNKDYLDQIYYAIGNVYLNRHDTATAIENYKISIEKSTRNGLDKAQSLITLGDLYYNRGQYIKASPCFSDASQLIDQSHPEYTRVNNLAQVLGELAQRYETVTLQDSLQALGKMGENDRLAAINRVIEQKVNEEKEQQKKADEELRNNERLSTEIENMAVMDKRAMGGNQTADWYFYNKSTISKGKMEFQRKFGTRRLEDNWNRKDKAIVTEEMALNTVEANNGDEAKDSTQKKGEQPTATTNDKDPKYYLQQIPTTKEQLEASDIQIADALLEMGSIYDEKIGDHSKAIATYEEFIRRFPNDKRTPDAYFNCYRISEKNGNNDMAEQYKNSLVNKFPDTKYAKILSQPDFRAQLEHMENVQDSIYGATYKNFLKGNYQQVMAASNQMEKDYPVSPLIPKFLLLKSLSAGKMGDKDSLTNSLNDLLARYPDSDVSTMAKDIISLMKQGKEPQKGSTSNLANKRDALILNDSIKGQPALKGFRLNEKVPYLYYLITDPTEVKENWLLYYTASYNFTKFLVKDFDLRVKNGTLVVSGLDNLEEALWYAQGIDKDEDMQKLLAGKKHRSLVISEENSELIGRGYTIEQYEKFYQDSIVNRKKKKVSTKIELVGDQKQLDSLSNAANKLDVKEGQDLMNVKQTGLKPAETKSPNTSNQKSGKAVKSSDNSQKQPSDSGKPNSEKESNNKGKGQESIKTKTETDNKQDSVTEQTNQQSAQIQRKEPKKGLRKYKGLYTYDTEADHEFVILITKDGVDIKPLIAALEEFNKDKQPLLNLKVSQTQGNGFNQVIEVGILPDAKIAKSYLLQLAKDDKLREILDEVPHRRIVISTENVETLKRTGNIDVYMELFRRLYLGR
jgi:tetratricopeptide (TPR) repeat protein